MQRKLWLFTVDEYNRRRWFGPYATFMDEDSFREFAEQCSPVEAVAMRGLRDYTFQHDHKLISAELIGINADDKSATVIWTHQVPISYSVSRDGLPKSGKDE